MKVLLISLSALAAVVVLALVGLRLYYGIVVDPRVVEELHDEPAGPRAERVMLLTFPDGRELPVNYLREGNLVFAGADGRWWRTFRAGNVPVKVLIQGEQLSGRAHTVLDDAAYTHEVFERLRPDVPAWLPAWLDAYLVVIELDDSAEAPALGPT